MKKYWNALLYGSRKTRVTLLLMAVLSVLVLGCTLYAFAAHSFISGTAALFLGVWELIVGQSVSFKDIDKEIERNKNSQKGEDSAADRGHDSRKKEKDDENEDGDYLKNYSEKKLKQLLSAYKVKKTSKTVMVDSSAAYKISQCPAYIWRTSGKVHLLLLEKKPRTIVLEYAKVKYVLHNKAVDAHPEQDYEGFTKPSFINSLFSKYLPTYYEIVKGGRRQTVKNLYSIEPDICFTNTSAADLFDLLDVGFKVDDEYIRSGRFNDYFKEAYRFNILLKDGIYSVNEYKIKIQALLKRMSDETLHYDELEERLDQMVKYRIITVEYAEFYKQHKKQSKNRKEKR